MTTQNTHRENGDGDITVVEQQPVSETENETNTTPVPVDANASSAGEEKEDEVVRPFTDFIEEFRQAEEVHRGSSIREPEAEPFSSPLFTGENNDSAPPFPWENTLLENPLPSVESVGAEAPQASTEETVEATPMGEAQGDAPIPSLQQEEQAVTVEHATTEPEVPTASTSQTPPVPATERPVSPLLRPARHLRLPRHGGRQRDVAASSASAQGQQASSPAGEIAEAASDGADDDRRQRRHKAASRRDGDQAGHRAARRPERGRLSPLRPKPTPSPVRRVTAIKAKAARLLHP